MSELYSDLQFTNFPDAVDTYEYVQDIDENTVTAAQEYQQYITNKDYASAQTVLQNNPNLSKSLINADKINHLIDSIKSIQRLYLSDVQDYIQNVVVYKGEYSAAVRYAKYNIVLYNGKDYMCISNGCAIGTLPSDTNNWCCLTIVGEQGVPGIGLNFNGSWNAEVTYNSNSVVMYEHGLYVSTIDNNVSKTPAADSLYWTLLFSLSDAVAYKNNKTNLNATTMQDAIDEMFLKLSEYKIITATSMQVGDRLETNSICFVYE